jgi:uncharacterized protein (TIGR02118 family)
MAAPAAHPGAYISRMVKLTVLYGPPTDPAAFDAHYLDTHVGIVASIPGLVRNEVSRFAPQTADGTDSPYYLQADLYFDDDAALKAGLASPEGQAASADVANFATGTVTLLFAEVLRER